MVEVVVGHKIVSIREVGYWVQRKLCQEDRRPVLSHSRSLLDSRNLVEGIHLVCPYQNSVEIIPVSWDGPY